MAPPLPVSALLPRNIVRSIMTWEERAAIAAPLRACWAGAGYCKRLGRDWQGETWRNAGWC